ncbi:threonine ammonia-lyase, biosynthetic [Pseudomonas juntendi]|uniref:threonine ammonia-lyase, biosynthetic n=1 Tax=Pseudomonas juntendi TaxID=2666183 RepID=UPI0004A77F4B|nr:threonine ammonia-lyase, biosynthetic [Pseudomonas juntendi]MCL8330118.1 threonine ammonia-lyase, biosynthetic [Pseudomonas juntendi]OAK60778.1 PLP-dependent threonine dehydratase [Pseudomonas putida]PPB16486.1 threonine ammonia-lyase, biosynthetic [Pseudomonas aeruginosa]QEQ87889.1 threonine ammonia-lyase, biosynthetic [Pseudomonas putida]
MTSFSTPRTPATPQQLLSEHVRRIVAAPVYDLAIETPLQAAPALSARLGNQVLLKREDLQPTFSFKIRGAYTRLSRLGTAQRERGVITASAGNHAQGVALAAAHLGMQATIVMPTTTPSLKVEGVRSRGGHVVLHGESFPHALAHALKLADQAGATFVPPFDDPDVIAGQGTVAMEILRQHPGALDAIFVPVGGGGLIAGIAAYVKYLRPEVKVIGVEPDDSNCLQAAMAAGERVVLPQVGSFADGVAVAQVGAHCFELCRHFVDEVLTVSSDELCAAIKDIYDDTRSITEPSGALAVAGIKQYVAQHGAQGQTLVAIDSGANVNFDRLRHVAERAELGEQREAIIAVTIPEQPGSFRAFCQALGKRQITEFNYRYYPGQQARLFVGVQTHPVHDPRKQLLASLAGQGYAVQDLTDNELAKLHVRHTVGGHAAPGATERVLRFEFPERPGALLGFLERLGKHWNISLFHYRNHGAAQARVLAALEVPAQELAGLPTALDAMGYQYWDETDNPAYTLFLG